MDIFTFINDKIKEKMGFSCYFRPDSDLGLIKQQLNKGLMSPIQAEKKITRFYAKLKIKTKKFENP